MISWLWHSCPEIPWQRWKRSSSRRCWSSVRAIRRLQRIVLASVEPHSGESSDRRLPARLTQGWVWFRSLQISGPLEDLGTKGRSGNEGTEAIHYNECNAPTHLHFAGGRPALTMGPFHSWHQTCPQRRN